MSGPAAELPTGLPSFTGHTGRSSLAPRISLVAAAVAPRRSLHAKPAIAYSKVRWTKPPDGGALRVEREQGTVARW